MNPVLPPLMSALQVTAPEKPFIRAVAEAKQGCDAGLVVYSTDAAALRAAIVLAPEVSLGSAMVMLPVCGIGFQNALGALAPPEVAVHLEWNGVLRVNGAPCGCMRVASDVDDPSIIPNWLVIGLDVDVIADGDNPLDRTALMLEGCGDVTPEALLEAWARHSLLWISRWEEDGITPVLREWKGLAHGIGSGISDREVFEGLGRDFGMIIREGETTRTVPLTTLLERHS